ncbi:Diaminopimelate epimerase [hydrothermal vent metagenome]|uniref:diaminopimelate epimerase n=1 Tax=hydrothermal vent metagenome TaxID=652676 RepID=A0A3B1BBU7_9ZZZZ
MIRFTKMHGLGNDFVVIDAIHQSFDLSAAQLRFIADRHFGVGCDQILLVEPACQPQVDFTYRIFNADGSEVEQCGNGARCFARFVHDKGLTTKSEIPVATASGIIHLRLQDDDQVTVNMGTPVFSPAGIPFVAETEARLYTLEVGSEKVELSVLSMGNPHAVLRVNDVDSAPVVELGRQIESHPRFPQRVNVGFMQVLDRQHIRLRVFERGSGETLACGSGACAAVVVGRQQGWLDAKVGVRLPGGELQIAWPGGNEPVMMTGPAVSVYEGELNL